jgi:hypothetical protein
MPLVSGLGGVLDAVRSTHSMTEIDPQQKSIAILKIISGKEKPGSGPGCCDSMILRLSSGFDDRFCKLHDHLALAGLRLLPDRPYGVVFGGIDG